MSNIAATDPDNPYQPKPWREEQKAKQRAKKSAGHPARVLRRSDAFAVACQQVGLRYKPIPAPRRRQDVLACVNPLSPEEHYARRHCPVSWEVLTERAESLSA